MTNHEALPFHALVRDRRRALGLSQGQLAAKVNENLVDVRHWEEGEAVPTAETIEKVAEALDLDPHDLAALVGAPDASAEQRVVSAGESDGAAVEAKVEVLVPETPDEADERWGAMWGEESAETGNGEIEDEAPDEMAALAGPDLPTAAIPPPQASAPSLPIATRSQPAVLLDPPVSYIEDPIQFRIYWLRAALLVVVTVVLLAVLAWSFGELFAALGQLLDQFGTDAL
jgi:transcriptional regulator with XRE-family HTH domain